MRCSPMEKLSLQVAALLARARSGTCMSRVYVNSTAPLSWRCAAGHQWNSVLASIRKGSWCPDCARVRRRTLEEMQEVAMSRGGLCLSNCYRNISTKLEWRCSVGHTWSATPLQVKRGHWCPFCAKVARLSLGEFQRIAVQRGGRCLSLQYANSSKPLQWKCAFGHEWLARASLVKAGTWCPTCARNQRLKYEDMQKIANHHSGKCISTSYKNGSTPLMWECRYGHHWSAAPAKVTSGARRKGTWCPECYNNRRRFLPKHSIESMRCLARDRGGDCLSLEYFGSKVKLIWKCLAGHEWQALPTSVVQGTWCPVCARNQRLRLPEFQDIAARRGGYCLSQTYLNERTPLCWRCADGHQWMARPERIKRGAWCPKCVHLRRSDKWTSIRVRHRIDLVHCDAAHEIAT